MSRLLAFAAGLALGALAGRDVGVREESERIERLIAARQRVADQIVNDAIRRAAMAKTSGEGETNQRVMPEERHGANPSTGRP